MAADHNVAAHTRGDDTVPRRDRDARGDIVARAVAVGREVGEVLEHVHGARTGRVRIDANARRRHDAAIGDIYGARTDGLDADGRRIDVAVVGDRDGAVAGIHRIDAGRAGAAVIVEFGEVHDGDRAGAVTGRVDVRHIGAVARAGAADLGVVDDADRTGRGCRGNADVAGHTRPAAARSNADVRRAGRIDRLDAGIGTRQDSVDVAIVQGISDV